MVRKAIKEDINCINELRKQVNQVHINGRPDIFQDGFSQELQNSVNEFINQEGKTILVVVRDKIICGFASIQFIDKPNSVYQNKRKFLEIHEFGVDKQYRKQGVGTELFNYIKLFAKEEGYCRIELDMWEFNKSALKFYESVGMKTYRRYLEFEK